MGLAQNLDHKANHKVQHNHTVNHNHKGIQMTTTIEYSSDGDTRFVSYPPTDDARLYTCQVRREGDQSVREYLPVPVDVIRPRMAYAFRRQRFSGIHSLLIQTRTHPHRYYPVARLLDMQAPLPHFAEEAFTRVLALLEGRAGVEVEPE